MDSVVIKFRKRLAKEKMSCMKCKKAQNEPKSVYYRWKNANIEIKGCDKHLQEIFDALNLIQGMKAEDNTCDVWAKIKKIMGEK